MKFKDSYKLARCLEKTGSKWLILWEQELKLPAALKHTISIVKSQIMTLMPKWAGMNYKDATEN